MTMSFVRLTNDKYGSTGLGLLVPTLVNTITDLWNTCSWYMYYLLGSKRVPVLQYLHIRLTFDHFWATRPKLHSTISIIAWFFTLEILIFSTMYLHIWLILDNFFEQLINPTHTRPFDTRSEMTRLISYSFTPYY